MVSARKLKLGVINSLWAYAEQLSVEGSLERIARLGLQHVDILGILHGDPHILSRADKKRIQRHLRELKLTFGSLILLPPGNIATTDEGEREACWRYVQAGIDQAAKWGGSQVLFNGGKRVFGVPKVEAWKKSVDFLHGAAEYAGSQGISINLEAEPYIYFLVNDLETTLRMLHDVDHACCMTTLDVGHLNLSRDAPDELAPARPWTMRLHLSENDGKLHANDVLGTGSVDFAGYLQAVQAMEFGEPCRQKGLDFVAVMELGILDDPIPDPDEYARRSMSHVLVEAPFLTLE